jgi:hypothetical protein
MPPVLPEQSTSSSKPPRNRRFPVKWSLIASAPDGEHAYGRIVDISTTGLQMQVPIPNLLGSTVQVEMNPSPGVAISVKVKIVRIHVTRGPFFFYGARIIVPKNASGEPVLNTLLHETLLQLRREQLAPDFARSRN